MEIPDLEEEEREQDITTMVAEAPRNTTRAVQSLKQLDKEIKQCRCHPRLAQPVLRRTSVGERQWQTL
ncbi:hypothetical protein PI126_g21984, partial [Phytophthora idaei]